MTLEQYKKFIDATLLAAACEYFNQQALASVNEDLQRIITKYNFKPNAPNTDKEFENFMLSQRQAMKRQRCPDLQTEFLLKRFFNVLI